MLDRMATSFYAVSVPTFLRTVSAVAGHHFLTRTLKSVRTEMSLLVLAYNNKRMIQIFGVAPLMAAIRA